MLARFTPDVIYLAQISTRTKRSPDPAAAQFNAKFLQQASRRNRLGLAKREASLSSISSKNRIYIRSSIRNQAHLLSRGAQHCIPIQRPLVNKAPAVIKRTVTVKAKRIVTVQQIFHAHALRRRRLAPCAHTRSHTLRFNDLLIPQVDFCF